MNCFYCGRPYSVENNENGVYLVCRYPRCKAQPCSDSHEDIKDCEEDMKVIQESWRNVRR